MTDMAMSPLDRLELFEQARVAIDRLYVSRAIDASTRRERLIAARDAAGITAMRANARTTTATTVEAEDEKRRLRRQKGDRNRHARKKAAEGGAVHG